MRRSFLGGFFLVVALFFGSVYCESQIERKVQLSQLHSLVGKLLESHLGQRAVDATILQQSRRNFISLFDRSKIYLLADEVDLFLGQKNEVEFFKEYNQGSFEVYERMLACIQNSIHRSKKIRETLRLSDFHDIEQIRRLGIKEQNGFATSTGDLTERIFRHFQLLISKRLPPGGEGDFEAMRAAVVVAEKEFGEFEAHFLAMSTQPNDSGNSLFVATILKSILLAFDAHSDLFSDSGAKMARGRLSKETFGSGIAVLVDTTGCRIAKIIKGSPADRLGDLFLNDRITRIDGEDVLEMTDEEIAQRLDDETNEVLSLSIERTDFKGGFSPLTVYIPKRIYVLEEDRVTSKIEETPYGNILIMNLYCFYAGKGRVSSQDDIRDAIESAQAREPIAGIILDLRDNGGGYISEAVRVVGLFIKTGVVMESVYADGSTLVFRDLDPKKEFFGPIIVLTSYSTASAAEIVTQALKDYGRCIVVGDPTTYGKGSIQMQTVTEAPKKGECPNIPMRMTIGNFYTVSGFCPQGVGVCADIVLPSYGEKHSHENPIVHPNALVGCMFSDTLEDVAKPERVWYKKNYLPFLEHPTNAIREYIPLLRQKSLVRLEKDPLFSSLRHNITSFKGNHKVQQLIREAQMAEAIQIMEDLLQAIPEPGKGEG